MEPKSKAAPPWGMWEVLLAEPFCKVKRIRVDPGHRLSYQKHAKRREHWLIVRGVAQITLDGVSRELRAGESTDIPAGAAHRIANVSGAPMTFIEVQTGSYFGEDDIVRLEDDYGRADDPDGRARDTKGEPGTRKR